MGKSAILEPRGTRSPRSSSRTAAARPRLVAQARKALRAFGSLRLGVSFSGWALELDHAVRLPEAHPYLAPRVERRDARDDRRSDQPRRHAKEDPEDRNRHADDGADEQRERRDVQPRTLHLARVA